MQLQHRFTVPVDPETAWETFNDLERIAPCFPGATLTAVEGDNFGGNAKVKLGPVSLQYTGTGRFVRREPAERRAVIEASGKDRRGNGTASATVTAHLQPEDGGTAVVVDTDLKITGRPAQFGRGMIQDVGSRILDQFAACLAERLGEGPAATATEPAEPGAAAGGLRPSVEGEGRAEGSAAPEPRSAPVPPRAEPATPGAAEPQPAELDLGAVVLPALLRRYGPVVAACVVTALVTWRVARRRT